MKKSCNVFHIKDSYSEMKSGAEIYKNYQNIYVIFVCFLLYRALWLDKYWLKASFLYVILDFVTIKDREDEK